MRGPAICVKTGLNRGAWSPEEDEMLSSYIKRHGGWNWGKLPKYAGLNRSGKSCRLRWLNYLRPDLKRGSFTAEEDELVHKLHEQFGNSWSKIAASLPGRSDNEIKNYWHTNRKKRSEPNAESKKAKWKPKSVLKSTVLDDVAPIILETSGFGLIPPHKSYDFGNELVELETMPQIFTSLPRPHDENAVASCGSNYNITSVLDFPMSLQNPEGFFSPLAASDEALVTKTQNTEETVILAEPTSGIDGIDWSLLSQNLEMAFVLAEASLLPPFHPYEHPYLFYNGYG